MSANQNQQYTEEEHDQNAQFDNEDIVEVYEDDGQRVEGDAEGSDDEYDGPTGFVPDDGQGPYHGEIIIGGPGPGEEDFDMDGEGQGKVKARRPRRTTAGGSRVCSIPALY